MFRVSRCVDEVGRGTVLKVEGRLVGAWVDELSHAVSRAFNGSEPLTLDLDGLSFLDARGVQVLRDTRERGARLVGGSTFVTALIRQGAHHDDPTG